MHRFMHVSELNLAIKLHKITIEMYKTNKNGYKNGKERSSHKS